MFLPPLFPERGSEGLDTSQFITGEARVRSQMCLTPALSDPCAFCAVCVWTGDPASLNSSLLVSTGGSHLPLLSTQRPQIKRGAQ